MNIGARIMVVFTRLKPSADMLNALIGRHNRRRLGFFLGEQPRAGFIFGYSLGYY
jgi:hypothetical protein